MNTKELDWEKRIIEIHGGSSVALIWIAMTKGLIKQDRQAFAKELLEDANRMKQANVCTCDRKVCHCMKFQSAKENNAYNCALNDFKELIKKKI